MKGAAEVDKSRQSELTFHYLIRFWPQAARRLSSVDSQDDGSSILKTI